MSNARYLVTACAALALVACVGNAEVKIPQGPESLGVFGTASRTLGGPSLIVRSECPEYHGGSVGDRTSLVTPGDIIFEDGNHSNKSKSDRNPRSVCVTIENLGTSDLIVSFYDRPTSQNVFSVYSGPALIMPGASTTFCDRTSLVEVHCDTKCEQPDCHKFRWRVDAHVF